MDERTVIVVDRAKILCPRCIASLKRVDVKKYRVIDAQGSGIKRTAHALVVGAADAKNPMRTRAVILCEQKSGAAVTIAGPTWESTDNIASLIGGSEGESMKASAVIDALAAMDWGE